MRGGVVGFAGGGSLVEPGAPSTPGKGPRGARGLSGSRPGGGGEGRGLDGLGGFGPPDPGPPPGTVSPGPFHVPPAPGFVGGPAGPTGPPGVPGSFWPQEAGTSSKEATRNVPNLNSLMVLLRQLQPCGLAVKEPIPLGPARFLRSHRTVARKPLLKPHANPRLSAACPTDRKGTAVRSRSVT